jgi:hypothetical protein
MTINKSSTRDKILLIDSVSQTVIEIDKKITDFLLLMTVTAYVTEISGIFREFLSLFVKHCLLKGFLSLFELLFILVL